MRTNNLICATLFAAVAIAGESTIKQDDASLPVDPPINCPVCAECPLICEAPVGHPEDSEVDLTKLFEKGFCPEGVEPMANLEYARLTGDWFLHRTDEPFTPSMLPKCHHCNFDVKENGEFTATEEVQF